MLGTLFSGRISPKDKRDKLENKFGFRMTQKLEEEMTHMCNYSDYIWEKGREDGHEDGRKEGRKEGRQEGRKEGRKSMLLDNIINVTESICADTPDTIKANVMKAMSILKVPENEREDCMLQLKERGFLE